MLAIHTQAHHASGRRQGTQCATASKFANMRSACAVRAWLQLGCNLIHTVATDTASCHQSCCFCTPPGRHGSAAEPSYNWLMLGGAFVSLLFEEFLSRASGQRRLGYAKHCCSGLCTHAFCKTDSGNIQKKPCHFWLRIRNHFSARKLNNRSEHIAHTDTHTHTQTDSNRHIH